MKRLFKALILLGILFPVQVFALGLGELQTLSALNQPFKAELQLLRVNAAELKGLEVKLASEEDYARIGLERLPILSGLRFKLIRRGDAHYIEITSRRPINEPYLNFLLEVNWSRGRMLREYTVLLDPPELLGTGAPELRAPGAEATEAKGEEDESLLPPGVADSAITEESIVYGPVHANEKLWNIAREIRAERDATIPQIMMALLRNNPKAFYRNNVNNLKQGHVLRIEDPQDIYDMDAGEARLAFQRQYQLWQDYKQSRAKSAAEQATRKAQAAARSKAGGAAERQQAKEGVLTLERPKAEERVAGHLESSRPGSGKESEQLGELQEQLAEAEQNAEMSRQQNEEMHQRLREMEEQIASLQRLMQIKSDELVSLQKAQKDQQEKVIIVHEDDVTETTRGAEEEGPAGVSTQLSAVLVELRKSPQLMGILGGSVLLILTMLWVLARKRRNSAEYGYRFESGSTAMGGAYHDEDDYGVSPARTIEEDPLTQADIFVAYGNLEAAINLMSSAVEKDPANSEYQAKLNELSSMLARREKEVPVEALTPEAGTESLLPEAEASLHPEQESLEEESLLTSDDLAAFEQEFAGMQDTIGEEVATTAPAEGLLSESEAFDALLAEQPGEEAPEPLDEGLDFDLGGLDEELQQLTSEAEPSAAAEESVVEFDVDDLDEGMSELVSAEASDDEIESTIASALDEAAGPAQEAEETGMIDLSEMPEVEDDGLIEIGDHTPDLLNEVDEVGTKLDLARAYIDMGDPEGARSILDEVLIEGNESQIAQAHELLDQI